MNGIANHRIYVKLSYEEVSAKHLCVYSDHLAFFPRTLGTKLGSKV